MADTPYKRSDKNLNILEKELNDSGYNYSIMLLEMKKQMELLNRNHLDMPGHPKKESDFIFN